MSRLNLAIVAPSLRILADRLVGSWKGDRWPEATLTLVGIGPEEPGLRQQASDLGLRGVNFVVVPPDAIADWL